MELFLKYKVIVFRIIGIFMLLLGFIVYFWFTPKEGVDDRDIASVNVARMEASVKSGFSDGSKKSHKPDTSKFLEEFKYTKEKQMKYLTIIAIIFGIGFLGYSFIPRSDS